jgi:hypothetical protein
MKRTTTLVEFHLQYNQKHMTLAQLAHYMTLVQQLGLTVYTLLAAGVLFFSLIAVSTALLLLMECCHHRLP